MYVCMYVRMYACMAGQLLTVRKALLLIAVTMAHDFMVSGRCGGGFGVACTRCKRFQIRIWLCSHVRCAYMCHTVRRNIEEQAACLSF